MNRIIGIVFIALLILVSNGIPSLQSMYSSDGSLAEPCMIQSDLSDTDNVLSPFQHCFSSLFELLFNFTFPGRSDPFFTMSELCDFGQTAYGLSSADFNNDGLLDFVVSWSPAPWTKSVITLFYNVNGTEFITEDVFSIVEPNLCYIQDLDAADYDGDGDIDLFYTHNIDNVNGSGVIVWNDGTNHFIEHSIIFMHHSFNQGIEVIARVNPQLTSADFDGDGDIDFLIGDNSGLVLLYHNQGNGVFKCMNTFDFPKLSWGLASADFDNDGDIDAIVSCYNESKVYINKPWIELFFLDNDGSLSCFNSSNITLIGEYPVNLTYMASYGGTFTMSLHSIDYNNDGLMDFIAGGHGNVMLNIQQKESLCFKAFTAARMPAINIGPFSWRPEDLDLGGLTVGDFDNDGLDDVVVGGKQGFVRLLSNDYSLIDIVFPDVSGFIKNDEIRYSPIPLYSFLEKGISIVFGDLTVKTEELEPLSKVEFYLDDKLVFTDEQSPFEWNWDRFSFGRHKVKALAYNMDGEQAGFDDTIVWKFL